MISTHILDTTLGLPASDVKVTLQKKDGAEWINIHQGKTNADGRFVFENATSTGEYQIVFSIQDYFKKSARDCFFLDTPVAFKIDSTARKYHVPLLLNPFGYSTYRGS